MLPDSVSVRLLTRISILVLFLFFVFVGLV